MFSVCIRLIYLVILHVCSIEVIFSPCQKRLKDVQIPVHNNVVNIDDMPKYCIDARKTGSVSRFVNHSCEPNLFVQCVLSSHHDLELAQVVLFAAENITPSQVICCSKCSFTYSGMGCLLSFGVYLCNLFVCFSSLRKLTAKASVYFLILLA